MDDDTARESAQSGDSSPAADSGGEREEQSGADSLPPFDEQTTVPESSRAAGGTVYLVGAGPGDPSLLTVRARRLVETADVVLHDALTRDTLIDRIPTSAEVFDVGKRVEYKTPQSEINDLLVSHAEDGDSVVRLKGGDPFVFGRGGEEAQHLAEQGVPFEIVPGVSSVIAAPGLAGIPLTHRDLSSRFTVITGHETPDKAESSLDWAAIASEIANGSTLVVLMGVRTLERNVSALRTHGVDGDVPVALVEKAAWEDQTVVEGTLDTIVDVVEQSSISAPATTIVGDVVSVRDDVADELQDFDPV
ncbi:uroporphyrin-III C-methyltransferase [Haloplanus vescus]|uniref:uroporphyrinogen-III C-methyltransferase n=1 Tax=Haloplanus vescus TaxID=555874 RepID=A0A1H3YID5_9EURY|nr:uroporphyrinogen-III C-methyltransferase [Haloplanus vescus]SEA11306.1 uroporphyrin-III C-methyltransferase [Haloplanus vescus]